MKLYSEMTIQELKAATLRAIEFGDRDALADIKAETLARAARVIGEGRDTPELITKVEKLAKSR
jgi:hypothetical protein